MAIPVDSVDPLDFASIVLSMLIIWLSRMSTRAVDIILPQVTDFSSEARVHERHARMVEDGSGSGIILILRTTVSAEPELEPPSKTGTRTRSNMFQLHPVGHTLALSDLAVVAVSMQKIYNVPSTYLSVTRQTNYFTDGSNPSVLLCSLERLI